MRVLFERVGGFSFGGLSCDHGSASASAGRSAITVAITVAL
jgi:hypothetical protein